MSDGETPPTARPVLLIVPNIPATDAELQTENGRAVVSAQMARTQEVFEKQGFDVKIASELNTATVEREAWFSALVQYNPSAVLVQNVGRYKSNFAWDSASEGLQRTLGARCGNLPAAIDMGDDATGRFYLDGFQQLSTDGAARLRIIGDYLSERLAGKSMVAARMAIQGAVASAAPRR